MTILFALLALLGLAPASSHACDASLWSHVYTPARLQVLKPCVAVTGTIVDATHGKRKDGARHEPDGDNHSWIKLDPQFASFLNDGNRRHENGNLVFEIPCLYPVTQADAKASCRGYKTRLTLPPMGAHVEIVGALVTDGHHGWNEIHPVSSIRMLTAAAANEGQHTGDLVSRHTSTDASNHSVDVNVEPSRGFSRGHILSADNQPNVVSDISPLNLEGGPAAIRRLVVPVNLNAIERAPARARSHVGIEALEAVAPFHTHLDSAAAVIGEVFAVRVVTAILRALPGDVLGSSRASVLQVPLRDGIALQTSARSSVAFQERFLLAQGGAATLASATPDSVDAAARRLRVVCEFDHGEPPESTSRQVHSAVHHIAG